MTLSFLLAAACMLALPCAAQQNTTITRLDGSAITVADANAFARKILLENHVTGAQIAVLNHGKPVWSAAFGLAGKDPDRAFDRLTNTWAASLTKSIFATYIMTLVERGEFDLDKPIAAQLTRPLTAYPFPGDVASLLIADPVWPLVTPRMVLSHTSGLGNLYQFEPNKKMRLHYKPGTRFLYSGDGLNILQTLIEEKLGRPIEDLTDAAFFKPLNMARTGLAFRPDFLPDVADRFDRDEKFHAQTRRNARAAGSMATSADDMALFLTALLSNKIVNARTLQQMLAPQTSIRFAHQFQFGAQADAESPEPQAVGLAYGLGWGLLTHTKFGPAFFKEGHGDGAQTYMICFQKNGSCMVILTNSDNGEFAFHPLLEHILGDTVTPWEWECYTAPCIDASRKAE